MARMKIDGGVKTTLILNEKVYRAIKKHCAKNDITIAFFMRTAIAAKIIELEGFKR